MPPTNAQRAKIHIAKSELHISDDIYRDILFVQFKVESSSDLNTFQAEKLLDIFKAKGWKPKRSKKSKSSPIYNDPQRRKVVAMWITLSDEGVVKNRSDKALQAYVKRMTKVENLKWCNCYDLMRIVESLKSWAAREGIEID